MRKMNKKGGVMMGVIVALMIYIVGVLFIPFLADDVTTTRADLDCTNSSITDGTKINCLTVDILIPYVIWFFISAALGYLAGANQ